MTGGDVTVIVPVWNGRVLLERLLRGLRAQTQPPAEVLVVDDGSRDGSAELAESMAARAIRMGTNSGFARAVNRAIGEARTPLVAIVNNDVELASDWIERLAAALTPDVWFATGRILQAAARDRIDATYDEVCRGGTAWRVGHGCRDGAAFAESRLIWCAPMTAALYRAGLFRSVGLLDERFESYLEDVDFGLRCAMAGYAGCYVPGALAWHQGSATLGRWHAATVRRISRNQVLLVAKHFPSRLLWRYGWPVLVAQVLWGLVALRHGRSWSWLRGKWDGLLRLGELRGRPASQSVAQLLAEGEREIRRVQRDSGRDIYWTLYFFLTAGGAK
ncbi:MAG TPA: glycosyltransferase family 2 protein [Bryobacteraceae bacterium]|nr:glycosyltransferase family 2 protein [Bryobacteraceae bacterium]